ncbi:Por secretion system C-terminal sorting domain-containing protein [Kaistella chaponensis]|uniref:Por secretion system C-terminal sorting domain-containing protein n=1 Tax=Kaistella chaponensis TaxID=713588 RepID=A0A1N7J6R6_9FLAO|nr:T9SS type A sorting domain-containing protein [Kaistella chaponensis]SIS45009.1 Por secretion system C-terminal sorting domain-containing protein [Kaistella chaponensis]
MKTILLQLKKQLTFIILLFISVGIMGQTLIAYPLNNNLNSNVGPIGITNPSINYYDPPTVAAPNFLFNHLLFQNNLDEVRFSFTAPTPYNDGLILQLHTTIAGAGFGSISANIQIFMQVDSQPETKIDEKNLTAGIFIAGGDSDDFSVPLTGINVSSQVKIRIVGTSSASGATLQFFGVNNLKLVRNTTTISVRSTKTPQPPFITHNAGASLRLDTDFKSRLTNEEWLDITYLIENTGSRVLEINSMQLVPNNVGFSIIGTVPATINAGQNATFTVRFAPTDQGIKTAEVVIGGNIVPNNPFRFEVKGNGKSCNLGSVPILVQNFETSGSNLNTSVISAGAPGSTGATSNTPNPTLGTGVQLYPAGTNLYSAESPTRSIFVRGSGTDASSILGTGEVTLEFGPVDLTGQQEVSVNFEVAAFSTSNVTSSNTNTGSGVNGFDYVKLQIMKPDGTFSDEIQLKGSPDTDEMDPRSYKYGFGQTIIPESNYDGMLYTVNNTNTTKYGKFKLNIPVSALTNNFKFRIVAKTGQSGERKSRFSPYDRFYNRNLWLIDNVHVDAGNAKVKTWNGTGWTGENTNKPGSREKALFAGNYNFTATNNTGNLSVCECEVNAGVNLTIPTGKFLSVRNKIINHDPIGNNFVVESDANLLQEENGIVNSDNITAKRIIKVGAARNQYNYLGTPVNFASGETFKTIYPNATFVLYHNEANNMFYNSSGVNIPGRGLAVKEPTGSGATNVTATFRGVPQNGNVILPIANSNTALTTLGYNLVGNPYPSNIDLLSLYDNNGGQTGDFQAPSPNISATFYFWDNNGNGQFTQQGTGYQGQAYATFNVLAGSTGTGTKSSLGTKVPTNIVKVGQGFMTRAFQSNYSFKFNNRVRTDAVSSADFLGKGNSNVQDDRYWLQLTAPSGITSTIAVVHYASGNNAFGPEDSRSMGGSDAIYTMVENEKIAIEGRSSFANTDRIYLGTKHFATGNYTIGLDDKEGIFANGQSIYLKDLQTGIITNLSDGNYTFQANAGESTGRFEIIYKPESVLATNQTVKESVIVYRDGTDFIVKAENKKITALEMYDSVGRLIYSAKPNAVKVNIPTDRMLNGVYILKIDQGGTVTTKKVIR